MGERRGYVDVAVYAGRPLRQRELVKLAQELEDYLGTAVDVVAQCAASAGLGGGV
ncbi:MAG: hypothetical protein OWQ51_11395 [Pyrobaculum arsenaticum]|uniref:Uncharacterized protein n=1 Tax=Pyrobaculum arsenaticum TaxID=121277 RepID=A0A7L4PAD3_9CREN|nr:hypothetical protein [Pyrobaculum arsenaticum]MCY0891550.1 hypothetical protein [Pyrobaculum arsenaticum]NYR15925.1 hypothetical protein [Pyrobaculum arsenaticum]